MNGRTTDERACLKQCLSLSSLTLPGKGIISRHFYGVKLERIGLRTVCTLFLNVRARRMRMLFYRTLRRPMLNVH